MKFSSTPDITQACSFKFSEDAISRNSKLRTLFFTNPTALEEPGGAENYMTNLQKGLNVLGNVADFYTGLNSIKDYDLVTFANSMEYSHLAYLFVKKARSYNKIAVNMPIYWDFSSLFPFFERFAFNLMRFFEKKIVHLVHRPLIRQKLEYAVLSMLESNLVLVSGENEAKLLKDHFGVPTDIVKTLPVCVDESFCNSKPKLFESTYGITDFILLAGNRLRRKNVLRLLDAYSQLEVDAPLVIIGSEKDEHFSKEFSSKLSKINSSSSKKKVIHIENLPPSSELLKSAYASSKVFVLPSYYETPGIAALEAGIAGSNIAITSVGTTKEYFKNHAEYIDPCSTESIENAIEKAYSKPRNSALKNFILKNYSIEAVAQKFLEITKPFVSSV